MGRYRGSSVVTKVPRTAVLIDVGAMVGDGCRSSDHSNRSSATEDAKLRGLCGESEGDGTDGRAVDTDGHSSLFVAEESSCLSRKSLVSARDDDLMGRARVCTEQFFRRLKDVGGRAHIRRVVAFVVAVIVCALFLLKWYGGTGYPLAALEARGEGLGRDFKNIRSLALDNLSTVPDAPRGIRCFILKAYSPEAENVRQRSNSSSGSSTSTEASRSNSADLMEFIVNIDDDSSPTFESKDWTTVKSVSLGKKGEESLCSYIDAKYGVVVTSLLSSISTLSNNETLSSALPLARHRNPKCSVPSIYDGCWKINAEGRDTRHNRVRSTGDEELDVLLRQYAPILRKNVIHMYSGMEPVTVRELWVVDSVFAAMPNATLRWHVLIDKQEDQKVREERKAVLFAQFQLFWRAGFDFQFVEHDFLSSYVRGTPLERHVDQLALDGKHFQQFEKAMKHLSRALLSDIMRAAFMYVEGGIYLDTDVVVLQEMRHLLNFVVCETNLEPNTPCNMCGAVAAFSAGHPRISQWVEALALKLDESPLVSLALKPWGVVGPRLMMELHAKWRHSPHYQLHEKAPTLRVFFLEDEEGPNLSKSLGIMSEDDELPDGTERPEDFMINRPRSSNPFPDSVTVYGPDSIYPLYWTDGANYVSVYDDRLWLPQLALTGKDLFDDKLKGGNTYTLHLFGSRIFDEKGDFLKAVEKADGSYMTTLMETYCVLLCGWRRASVFGGSEMVRTVDLYHLHLAQEWLEQHGSLRSHQ